MEVIDRGQASGNAIMNSGITRDEWLKALDDTVTIDDPDALTVLELAELMHISRAAAYRKAQAMVTAGRAVLTSKRVTYRGFTRSAPAYRLLAPGGKK